MIRLVPMGQILNVGLPLYARSRPWMVKHWPTSAGLPLQRGGPAKGAARSSARNDIHIIFAFVRYLITTPWASQRSVAKPLQPARGSSVPRGVREDFRSGQDQADAVGVGLVAAFRKCASVFRGKRSLTVAAPIRAKRFPI